MKTKILILVYLVLFIKTYSQDIKNNNNLIILHGDITLYLTKDTCTMISKHVIKYVDFMKLDSERDNLWFQDIYKNKYNKNIYLYSGYDIGHLTPSHITSYDNILNHNSFSLFNAAPQLPYFNRGLWNKLEKNIEDTISKHKKDAIIITGVIYDEKPNYLKNSKIPIPTYFYKIIFIDKKKYCWLGSNINGKIEKINLKELNIILKNNMKVFIK